MDAHSILAPSTLFVKSAVSNPKDHHEFVRNDVSQVAHVCSKCSVKMGEYFCEICKFYNDGVHVDAAGVVFVMAAWGNYSYDLLIFVAVASPPMWHFGLLHESPAVAILLLSAFCCCCLLLLLIHPGYLSCSSMLVA